MMQQSFFGCKWFCRLLDWAHFDAGASWSSAIFCVSFGSQFLLLAACCFVRFPNVDQLAKDLQHNSLLKFQSVQALKHKDLYLRRLLLLESQVLSQKNHMRIFVLAAPVALNACVFVLEAAAIAMNVAYPSSELARSAAFPCASALTENDVRLSLNGALCVPALLAAWNWRVGVRRNVWKQRHARGLSAETPSIADRVFSLPVLTALVFGVLQLAFANGLKVFVAASGVAHLLASIIFRLRYASNICVYVAKKWHSFFHWVKNSQKKQQRNCK